MTQSFPSGQPRKRNTFVAVILGIAGVVLATYGLYQVGLNVWFLVMGDMENVRVVATHVATFQHVNAQYHLTDDTAEFAIVELLDGSAKGARIGLSGAYKPGTIHVGDTIRVLVLNGDPPKARDPNPEFMWPAPIIISIFGIIFVVATTRLSLTSRRS